MSDPLEEKNHPFPSLRRLRAVVIGSTLIALLLWATKEQNIFFPTWVFAECVGLSICTVFTVTHYYTHARFGYLVAIALGVLIGYPIGIMLASALGFGHAAHEIMSDWHALIRYVVPGVIFTLAFMYFFHSRMRIVELERERQEADLRETTAQKTTLLAELRLLQAQIEPHFLFNTLANLHSLIGHDDVLAKQLLEQLNDYLRASLAHSRARQATLGDECNMLNAYLAIQQQRMGERLDAVLDVDPALRGEAFPPMLLQPLVENAIIHGVEPKVGNGKVRVRAMRDNGILHIVIEDDGVGFNTAQTAQGMGIANVRERLAALFGGHARLEIKENTPTGVVMELWLPSEQSAP